MVAPRVEAGGRGSPLRADGTVESSKAILSFAAVRIPSFAKGGTVPGPSGEPRVIIAHGGEEVKPQPIHLGSGGGGGGNTVSVKVDMPLHMDNAKFGGDVTMADLERWHDRAVEKVLDEIDEALSGAG
jgi:hypothetical protein